MKKVYLPVDKKLQSKWFKFAGIKKPKNPKVAAMCLFAIAHMKKQTDFDYWAKSIFKYPTITHIL